MVMFSFLISFKKKIIVFTESHKVNWGSYITLLKACCSQHFLICCLVRVLAAERAGMPSLTQSPLRQITSPWCAWFPSCKMGRLAIGTSQERWEGGRVNVCKQALKKQNASSKAEGIIIFLTQVLIETLGDSMTEALSFSGSSYRWCCQSFSHTLFLSQGTRTN